MPAKAGIQNCLKTLVSPSTLLRVVSLSNHRLRGNDARGCIKTFYQTIKIGMAIGSFPNRN